MSSTYLSRLVKETCEWALDVFGDQEPIITEKEAGKQLIKMLTNTRTIHAHYMRNSIIDMRDQYVMLRKEIINGAPLGMNSNQKILIEAMTDIYDRLIMRLEFLINMPINFYDDNHDETFCDLLRSVEE